MGTKKNSKKKTVSRKKTPAKKKTAKKGGVKRKSSATKKKTAKKQKKVVRKKKSKKRVSIRGTRAQVWRGTRQKVKTTGQTKGDLMKNKNGKIVSKKAYKAGQKAYKAN